MSHPDFLTYCRTARPRTIVLLYHWDCDGLASAAMVQQALAILPWNGTLHLLHPQINYYFLTPRELEHIRALAPDVIVTVDLNFSQDVIFALEQCVKNIFVFDHHEQTAKINKPGLQDPTVPGCSFLLASALRQPQSLIAVLGMIGDQEDRLASAFPAFYTIVERVLAQEGLDFATALRITKRIDMLSMIGDHKALEYGIALLRDDPRRALSDPRLNEYANMLAAELTRWETAMLHDDGMGVFYGSLDSPYHILSEITRRQAKKYSDHIIICDQHLGEWSNLYVRTRRGDIDLSFLVDIARKRGYNAGGKKEVAGILLPLQDFSSFRQEVFELLHQHFR